MRVKNGAERLRRLAGILLKSKMDRVPNDESYEVEMHMFASYIIKQYSRGACKIQ